MMGWQGDDDLVTRTIANWHGGRLPVGADKGATMDDDDRGIAAQTAETRAARAATRLRGVTARDPDERAGDPTPEEALRRGRDALWEAGADWGRMTLEHQPAPDEERAALRAAVARLAGEIDGWRERNLAYANRLATAESERDAARAALDGLLADVEHFAIIQHRALHGPPGVRDPDRPPSAAWRDCRRDGCPGLRRAVARARAATGGER